MVLASIPSIRSTRISDVKGRTIVSLSDVCDCASQVNRNVSNMQQIQSFDCSEKVERNWILVPACNCSHYVPPLSSHNTNNQLPTAGPRNGGIKPLEAPRSFSLPFSSLFLLFALYALVFYPTSVLNIKCLLPWITQQASISLATLPPQQLFQSHLPKFHNRSTPPPPPHSSYPLLSNTQSSLSTTTTTSRKTNLSLDIQEEPPYHHQKTIPSHLSNLKLNRNCNKMGTRSQNQWAMNLSAILRISTHFQNTAPPTIAMKCSNNPTQIRSSRCSTCSI